MLKLNPFSIFDTDEKNISIGAEYKIKKRKSICLNIGYITASEAYQNVQYAKSFIIKPSFRYYISKRERTFVESEFSFKTSNIKAYNVLLKGIVNGSPTYEKTEYYSVLKYVYGLNIKYGSIFKLSKNNKFWLEANTGIGIKYKIEQLLADPNSSTAHGNYWYPILYSNQKNTFIRPNFCLNVSFMYKIK